MDRQGMRAARKARLEAADTRLRDLRAKRTGEADAGPMWPWLALSIVGVVGTLLALTNPLGDLSWVLAVGGVALAVLAWFLSRPSGAAESAAKRRKDRTRA